MRKYRNKKVTVDGVTFDSVKECLRYKELRRREINGEIQNLQRQVEYLLIPSQKIGGKVVERPCKYIADFVYHENGNLVVEDCKGFRTPDYIIKRKLMLKNYGIRVKET